MADDVGRRLRVGVAIATFGVAVVSLLGVGAAPAAACDANNQRNFGISPGCADVRISATPTGGDPGPDLFRAGGHPYEVLTLIRLDAPSEEAPGVGAFWPPEPLRDLTVELPPGLVANPTAVPRCPIDDLSGEHAACPAESQVGTVVLYSPLLGEETPTELEFPLYLLEAPSRVAATFGFDAFGLIYMLNAGVSSEGRLSIQIKNIGEVPTPVGMDVSLWGVPADPDHTPDRSCAGRVPPYSDIFSVTGPGPACVSSAPERAFLTLPTNCAGAQPFSFTVDSWFHPGVFQSETADTHRSPGLLGEPSSPAPYPGADSDEWGAAQGFVGCGRVGFQPSLSARADRDPATGQSDLDVEISQPQDGLEEPEAISEADLEGGSIELPGEFAINPSVANGLSFCTAADANLGSEAPAACPSAAKLGTAEIQSALMSTPLVGSIYAAEPTGQATSTTTIPAYIVAEADGISVKLPSRLSVNSGTGRLRAAFGPIPQLPLSRIDLRFFGGERAPFLVSSKCGRGSLEAQLDPWSGAGTADVDATVEFSGSSGCSSNASPPAFAPGFTATVADPHAGARDALALKLTRADGEQEPSSLQLSLPAGVAAAVGNVGICPGDVIAAAEGEEPAAMPDCPADSQVGEMGVAVGAGKEPLHPSDGKVFLGGPYQGAQFSLVAGLPVALGKLDLGALLIQLPLRLDPRDGHLTVGAALPSGPVGVALDLRELTIKINRPGFLVNPTACGQSLVQGRVEAKGGRTVAVSSDLGIVGCRRLAFQPRLRIEILRGRHATRHGGHPTVSMDLSRSTGNANFAGATVTFPAGEQLDPTRLMATCDVTSAACPAKSVYGHVKAFSPLFSEPLTGPVYLHRSKHRLFDLVVALHGPLDVDLKGSLGFAGGRMRVKMASIPDLPVSKLDLTVRGGRRGLLINNRNLCRSPSFATTKVTAHNGKVAKGESRVIVPCADQARAHHRARRPIQRRADRRSRQASSPRHRRSAAAP